MALRKGRHDHADDQNEEHSDVIFSIAGDYQLSDKLKEDCAQARLCTRVDQKKEHWHLDVALKSN